MKIYQCYKSRSHNEYICFNFSVIQFLNLMYSGVAWVLVSLGTQNQSQIVPDPDYLPDHLSVSYDYEQTKHWLTSWW